MTNDNQPPQRRKNYSGTDNIPWVVKGTNGKAVIFEKDGKTATQFNSFKDADFEARKYTNKTGEFAQPVRS